MSENETPRLLDWEYWKWRYLISELQKAKVIKKCSDMEFKLLQKNLELQTQQIQLHLATKKGESEALIKESEQDYEAFKKEIETRLDISLNNKMIDEATLAVVDAPVETKL